MYLTAWFSEIKHPAMKFESKVKVLKHLLPSCYQEKIRPEKNWFQN